MNKPRVFVGYDDREKEAYDVCEYSLRKHTDVPVSMFPVGEFLHRYTRTWHEDRHGQRYDDLDHKPFSTGFSFARFLVPYLAGYKGWALFCDCDFLFLADIQEVFALKDERFAVQICRSLHQPKESIKMDGKRQEVYPRKNWSSFVLWNCGHEANKALTPNVVNTADGSWLHGFKWLADSQIGDVPQEWNWLVGYYPDLPTKNLKALHYTTGGPWFNHYKDVPYAADWLKEFHEMNAFPLKEKKHGSG